MSYKFFDKKYLVMPDDRDIIGKKVFYADHLDALVCDVESGDLNKAGKIDDIFTGSSFPFYINNSHWGLAYYDPNYECKVAYSQGKQIQYYSMVNNSWTDTNLPEWGSGYEYRVKPELESKFEVIKQDGVYKRVKSSLVPNFFSGTAEECDAWIAKHTPKTRRMTNRELVRWLAKGKGERIDVVTGCVSLYYSYTKGKNDEECDKDIRIREWDEDEWHEPLVEVKE